MISHDFHPQAGQHDNMWLRLLRYCRNQVKHIEKAQRVRRTVTRGWLRFDCRSASRYAGKGPEMIIPKPFERVDRFANGLSEWRQNHRDFQRHDRRSGFALLRSCAFCPACTRCLSAIFRLQRGENGTFVTDLTNLPLFRLSRPLA
jgi:hypothetical protein